MNRLEKLPPAFKRYAKMSGALKFALFEDAAGTEEEALEAIRRLLAGARTFDVSELRASGRRSIDSRTFFGEWYDADSGSLLKLGDYRTADGAVLHNPKLIALDGVEIMSGAAPCPEVGIGGQFAYAFSSPPYGIKGKPNEIQSAFEDIRDYIIPIGQRSEIFDWTNPHLPKVSDYFAAGGEWWGVFLFSIYVPELRRLTIIAGSATD